MWLLLLRQETAANCTGYRAYIEFLRNRVEFFQGGDWWEFHVQRLSFLFCRMGTESRSEGQ